MPRKARVEIKIKAETFSTHSVWGKSFTGTLVGQPITQNEISAEKRIVKYFFLISLFIAGCAGSNTRQDRTPNSESRAHPAAYLVDRFDVPKQTPSRPTSPVPFYFKSCTREVSNFIGTNTRYDCD